MSEWGSSAPQHLSGRSLAPGHSLSNGHAGNGHEWAFRIRGEERDPLTMLGQRLWGCRCSQDEAATRLQREIEGMMNSALSPFPKWLALRVRKDAAQHVMCQLMRRKFDPDHKKGGVALLRAWIRRVAYCYAVSHGRRLQPGGASPEGFDPADPRPGEPHIEDDLAHPLQPWHQFCQELRDGLDRCYEYFRTAKSEKRSRERIDYRAVLLLKLRLQIGQTIATYYRDRAVMPGEVAAEIAMRLPWSKDESGSRIRADLPTLGEIWNNLSSEFDEPPHYVDGCQLWGYLAQSCGSSPGTKNLWDNWVRRAKKNVVEWLKSLAKDQDASFDNLPEFPPFKLLLRIKGSSPEPPDRTS